MLLLLIFVFLFQFKWIIYLSSNNEYILRNINPSEKIFAFSISIILKSVLLFIDITNSGDI